MMRYFGLFFIFVYLGRPTSSSRQSPCSTTEEKLSANGVCSKSLLPCRNLCSGEVIAGAELCRQTRYCCMWRGICVLKTIESVNTAEGIFGNEKRVSQNLYQSARALLQDGPDNLEFLQRRSLTERWMPFNRSDVPPVIQPRFLSPSSRSRDPSCLPFPFNCQLPHYSATIEYQTPDINIPYCHRIPCRNNNYYLQINQPLCLSVPGCAFDSSLAFYRQVYGQGVMPGVPVCHLAIRNPAFIGAVTDFILKYKQTSWNPIFNRCMLEQKKEEIFRNRPGCEMVLLLENFGHIGKQAGWSNITQRECHMIGACWLKSSRCLYPVSEDGNSTIQSTQDLQGETSGRDFGEPQCAPISNQATEIVDDCHKCLAAGCALDMDDEFIRTSLKMMSQFVLPPKLYKQFRCMIEKGQVRPDNWKKVMNDLQIASATSLEQIMGSIPLARLGRDYNGINIKQGLTSGQLHLQLVDNLDNIEIPDLECEDIDNSNPMMNNPPLTPPGISNLVHCPFQFYQIPGLPKLAGRLDGCCNLPRCYLPRRLMNYPGALKSGIASYLTPWMTWSRCSETCGPGRRSRTRRCVGESCHPSAEMQQTQICGVQTPCSRMGQWSQFTSCNRKCWKTRTRMCLEGDCLGDRNQLVQNIRCIKNQCRPKGKSMLPWSAWSRCSSRGCGEKGVQTRRRMCFSTLGRVCQSNEEIGKRYCLGDCPIP